MRSLTLVSVLEQARDDAYALLAAFERYPGLAPEVLDVAVRPVGAGPDGLERCESDWRVKFRRGVLVWTELDVFDPTRGTIEFQQTDGDLEHFSGSWRVDTAADGKTVVTFEARFDLGVPGLSEFLEPVAAEALARNMRSLLDALFGSSVRHALLDEAPT